MKATDLKAGDVFYKIGFALTESIDTRRYPTITISYHFKRGEILVVLSFRPESGHMVLQKGDGTVLELTVSHDSSFNTHFDHFFRMF